MKFDYCLIKISSCCFAAILSVHRYDAVVAAAAIATKFKLET